MASQIDALLEALAGQSVDPQQAKLKMLQQQLAQADALSNSYGPQYRTPIGRAFGATADAGQQIAGALQARGLRDQISGIQGQQSAQAEQARQLQGQRLQQLMAREDADRQRAEQERQRLEDPNSEVSQLLGGMGTKRGYAVQPGVTSGATLMQLMGLGQKDYEIQTESGDKGAQRGWEREKFGLEQKVAEGKATEAERIRLQEMDEGLRKELAASPAYKGFLESSAAFNKLTELRAATKTDPKNTSNDVAFVYSLMKMIDAGAAVQEGDKANAEATANLKGQLMNALDKAIHGTGLQPEQRESFYRTGVLMFQGQKKVKDQVEGFYTGLSKKQGGDQTSVAPVDFSGMTDEQLKALSGGGGG